MAESQTLGQYVASLKTGRDKVRDREAFIERSQNKYNPPTIAGLTMVGLGANCGKPAFLLPNVVRFNQENTQKLEAVAAQFGLFMEYGAYPHLKREDGVEVAAIQDWTNATMVYLRPSFDRKEELLTAIKQALA